MSSPSTLNPADFPESAYARELPRGITRLRFDSELEVLYVAAHLRRARLRVRLWFSVALVVAVLFSVAQTLRNGVWSLTFLCHAFGIVPLAAGMVWVAWSPSYQRIYMPVARTLLPLTLSLAAVFVAQSVSVGREEELAVLAVDVIGLFVFSGLLLRAALFSAASTLLAFAAAAVAFGMAEALALKSLAVLLVTSAMGGILYYDIEKSQRRSFIEAALIAELVARDWLSGLTNRRGFDEHLLRVWQQALRDRRSLAVLMVDVDHFKAYNDTHGHQAGDAALRRVAQLLKEFARRPLDLAARYGGEEFALIIYDLPPAHVQDLAERMRAEVAGADDVTVSVGVGIVTPHVVRIADEAVQLADEALYEAKRAGRDRVVVRAMEEYRALNTGSFRIR
jgi:diguanylate cyclase (GGDEF)-like protein